MAREREAPRRRQPFYPVVLLPKLILEAGRSLPMMDFEQQNRPGLGGQLLSSPQHFNFGPFDVNLDQCWLGAIFSKRIERHGLHFDRPISRRSAVR